MTEIVESLTVGSPPDVVWSVLADFGNISAWAPNVDHSCLTTQQQDGIGAVRRVQVGRNALLETIVRWEPNTELAYEIQGLPPVIRSLVNSWTIEGSGETTKVVITSHVDTGPRPPQKVVARILGKGLAKVSREMLTGLQAHLEEVAV